MDWLLTSQNVGRCDSGNLENLLFAFVHRVQVFPFSTQHTVGLHWVPGQAEVLGNKTTNKLARDGSVQKSVGTEPPLGISRQSIRR